MKTKGYFHSVIGSREKNQDSWLVDDVAARYAVADGIGGGLQGEVASKMAVDGLTDHRNQGKTLLEAFHILQDEIYQDAMDTFGDALMGTTLSAVELEGGRLTICHVGDSRAYLFDGNLLRQLTEDQEIYDESLHSTVLNSYLGIDANVHPIRITQDIIQVQPGHRLLLASDGLFKQMTDMRIVSLMREHFADPSHMLQQMCSEASKVEFSDNVTIVYVEIEA